MEFEEGEIGANDGFEDRNPRPIPLALASDRRTPNHRHKALSKLLRSRESTTHDRTRRTDTTTESGLNRTK